MNWKLILQLSLFGLIMAHGTVSLIPEMVEPAFWLVIFIFCAYIIARVCNGKYFLHGFFVAIVNCIWITIIHAYFYNNYAAHHLSTTAMYTGNHPRLTMLAFAPAFGIGFGVVLGGFAFIASKIVKKNPQ